MERTKIFNNFSRDSFEILLRVGLTSLPVYPCSSIYVFFFFYTHIVLIYVLRHRLHTIEPPMRRHRRRSLESAGDSLETSEKTRIRQQRRRSQRQHHVHQCGNGVGDDNDGGVGNDGQQQQQQQLQQQRPAMDRPRRKCKFRVLTTSVVMKKGRGPRGPRSTSPPPFVNVRYSYTEEIGRGATDLDLTNEFVALATITA